MYGGEMSAHHYFRRFAYCDSGMIPWLLVAQILSETGRSLSSAGRRADRRVPGERRAELPGARRQAAAMAAVESRYARAGARDRPHRRACRSNSRIGASTCARSNTEPLMRLNVEARGSEHLMRERTRGNSRAVEVARRGRRRSLNDIHGRCAQTQRRHPGLQRGGGAADPVRAALSRARRAGHLLRDACSSTTAARTARWRCCASNFSAARMKPAWCCSTPISASIRR